VLNSSPFSEENEFFICKVKVVASVVVCAWDVVLTPGIDLNPRA
jgi:hypothetical protein